MKNKNLYLFDLDGVILDSKKNMEHAWNSVNQKFELNVSFNSFFSHIGKDFKQILKKLKINDKDKVNIEKTFIKESLKYFDRYKLFPKVKVVLNTLKKNKIQTGIVTSKDCQRTKKILKNFSLGFDIIRCTDGKLPGKPSPVKILSILEKLKVSKKNAVYVGDMMIDKKTAKNAGIDYIHALYGYSSEKIKHKNTIQAFEELLKTKI